MNSRKEGLYPDSQWDQIHFVNRVLLSSSLNRSRHIRKFRPGDIAACAGNILATFYKYLQRLGVPLMSWEIPSTTLPEKFRYCIINRHIQGNHYEVFLMTTFGGARNHYELSPIAPYFGMPIGDTQWMRDLPGLKTTPPTFGMTSKSFVFAIPTVKIVEAANTHVHVRLVPGEMERLSEFVNSNAKRIHHDQARLRADLQSLLRSKSNWLLEDDAHDIFSPPVINDTQDVIATETRGNTLSALPERKALRSSLSPKRRPPRLPFRLPLPPIDDLGWLMRHLRRDIFHSSSFLDSLPVHRPRLTTLPEPFYAPCLRITAKRISRLIL